MKKKKSLDLTNEITYDILLQFFKTANRKECEAILQEIQRVEDEIREDSEEKFRYWLSLPEDCS